MCSSCILRAPILRRPTKGVKEYGVDLASELSEAPLGQISFRFYDPDHHLVEVGETMSAANVRLFKKGMSIPEIAAKTHLPEEIVKADIDKILPGTPLVIR